MSIWKGEPPAACSTCGVAIHNVFVQGSIDLVTLELWDVMCVPCHQRCGSGRLGPNTGHLYRKHADGFFVTDSDIEGDRNGLP